MLFRIAVCCVKKYPIKIGSSSVFLKLPVPGVRACVWALQKRSRILWGESLEQQCCLPASPLLLCQPLSLPALGSHRIHSALSKHLCVLVLRAHGVCECAHAAVRVMGVGRSPEGFHLGAVKEPGMYVGGWRATHKTGISVYRSQLCVTAVIYTAEILHLGSWTGCGLLEWRITIWWDLCCAQFPSSPLQLETPLLSLG